MVKLKKIRRKLNKIETLDKIENQTKLGITQKVFLKKADLEKCDAMLELKK